MHRRLLSETELAVLLALYDAARGNVDVRVSLEEIAGRFRKDYRGYVAEVLSGLARHGHVQEYRTADGVTYRIAGVGVRKVRELGVVR